ncbi:MAG: AtpZ/AtpI family protein [Deltaproteobacteria bacterium]|nr:AtpZ/AtpI family protein [Deltaproteobacteria bacterium]MBW2594718.1 AtpZ/AtpI family protein [Deltaproteobacteria bacterium]MBW2650103.1 AtpZ/AtpI family protein [Deltaproteobacteria bacterium]
MMITHHSMNLRSTLSQILQISVWGLVIVVSSFMFLYAGRWIDAKLNTEPSFMLGLFILAVFLCIWRLYGEARMFMKKMKKQ